eukprot:Sspe_Gene.91393::Locus_62892_Transcript_1_1_Confidence_1.000_Length_2028::g.91393::m.91393
MGGLCDEPGTLTPDLSPHMPPTPNMFKPSKPTPQTEYKLSSQVLLVGSDGIRPTTLLQLLVDAHGRVDRRGADTPRVGPIKSAWDREPPPDTEEDLNLVLPEKARTTKSAESDEVKVTSPADHPQRRTPPPPLDSSAVGRAAIDLAETCFSPIHPITPGQLDRIMTANSLEALRSDKVLIHPIPPTARAAMDYIQKAYDKEADCFSHDLDRLRKIVTHLCQELTGIMESEPVFQHVRSPCYVFGDIHGNFRDLLYFLDHIISFQDLHYTPSNVLFLGDYVDRGPHGLECVVLLLALKLSCPNQVTMLRGNHEDPLVNGDVRHYGSAAFQSQCITLFGRDDGIEVWRIINEKIFRMLPLAATIDEKIFCVHGGLPRYNGGFDDRLQMLQSPDFPKLEYFSVFDDCEDEDLKPWVQMACDLCWSDPREQEEVGGYYGMNDFGFAPNSRGSGTLAFGSKAVETFLKNHGYQYIFRAHQEKSDGLRLSKSARVVTIFSSSDYEGHRNGAGVLFVNHKAEIRMIIKQ